MSKVTKYKIVFAGDQNVGKTSIISRFMNDNFSEMAAPTVGIDFLTKTLQIDNETIRLQLWDTAGQERYRSLIPSYIKDADACIIVFDVSNKLSYDNMAKWIDFVKETRGDEALVFMVGNKVDCVYRYVDTVQGYTYAKTNDLIFFYVSAKTGHNIQNLFRNIAVRLQKRNTPEEYVQEYKTKKKQPQPTKSINLTEYKTTEKQAGCRC